MRGSLVLLCITLLAGSDSLVSQEKREPGRRAVTIPVDTAATSSPLPKIDLPEYTITGDEAIHLPSFSKAAVEERKIYDSKPTGPGFRESTRVDLGNPRKEQIAFSPLSDGLSGKIHGGYGSFQSPFIDAWFGKAYQTGDFLLKAGYTSTEGYRSNADNRYGYGSLEGGLIVPEESAFLPGGSVRGGLELSGNAYRLYGSMRPTLQRSITTFAGNVALLSGFHEEIEYTGRVHIKSTTRTDSGRSAETLTGVDFEATQDFGGADVLAEVNLWRSYQSSLRGAADPYLIHSGIAARVRLTEHVEVTGGLRGYVVRGSDTGTLGRVYPRLSLVWRVDEPLTLFARFEPSIALTTLQSLLDLNPYIAQDVSIRHRQDVIHFTIGAESRVARILRANASASITRSNHYPVFVDSGRTGMWSIDYSGVVRVVSLAAEIYLDLSQRDQIGGTMTYRSTRLSTTQRAVPYHPDLSISALYEHRFLFGLSVRTAIRFTGTQFIDLQQTRALKRFTTLDMNAEYGFLPQWAATLTGKNILNTTPVWWEGYQGRPRTVSMGLSFSW
jgi:outer membrane receptor protein involved in Fe transport